MKNLLFLFLIVFLASCNSMPNKKQVPVKEKTSTYTLELVWQSDTLVKTPESVLIDRERNILYVSCVNLNPWEKDGNGFITKMDLSGNIIEQKWIEGIDAPKGMGISGNSFFVADINTLVEANIETGDIVNKIELPGKPDLNDITVSADGTVYVSGSSSNTIYKLKDGRLEEIFKGTMANVLTDFIGKKNECC